MVHLLGLRVATGVASRADCLVSVFLYLYRTYHSGAAHNVVVQLFCSILVPYGAMTHPSAVGVSSTDRLSIRPPSYQSLEVINTSKISTGMIIPSVFISHKVVSQLPSGQEFFRWSVDELFAHILRSDLCMCTSPA